MIPVYAPNVPIRYTSICIVIAENVPTIGISSRSFVPSSVKYGVAPLVNVGPLVKVAFQPEALPSTHDPLPEYVAGSRCNINPDCTTDPPNIALRKNEVYMVTECFLL